MRLTKQGSPEAHCRGTWLVCLSAIHQPGTSAVPPAASENRGLVRPGGASNSRRIRHGIRGRWLGDGLGTEKRGRESDSTMGNTRD
jgi:hypothetical protein